MTLVLLLGLRCRPDIVRGPLHDLLSTALVDILAVLGGPNCRTWSRLRFHTPGPPPLRVVSSSGRTTLCFSSSSMWPALHRITTWLRTLPLSCTGLMLASSRNTRALRKRIPWLSALIFQLSAKFVHMEVAHVSALTPNLLSWG
eukprot:3860349-Amphidinium_carterae.2